MFFGMEDITTDGSMNYRAKAGGKGSGEGLTPIQGARMRAGIMIEGGKAKPPATPKPLPKAQPLQGCQATIAFSAASLGELADAMADTGAVVAQGKPGANR